MLHFHLFQIILGVMDDFGDVYIYQIKENLKNKSLSSELLLSISSSLNTSMINDSDKEIISPRIFWWVIFGIFELLVYCYEKKDLHQCNWSRLHEYKCCLT